MLTIQMVFLVSFTRIYCNLENIGDSLGGLLMSFVVIRMIQILGLKMTLTGVYEYIISDNDDEAGFDL